MNPSVRLRPATVYIYAEYNNNINLTLIIPWFFYVLLASGQLTPRIIWCISWSDPIRNTINILKYARISPLLSEEPIKAKPRLRQFFNRYSKIVALNATTDLLTLLSSFYSFAVPVSVNHEFCFNIS